MIDWNRSSAQLERFVRALSGPYPSAFTYLDGDPTEITAAEASERDSDGDVGEVLDVAPPDRLSIQTASGSLVIEQIGLREGPKLTGSEFPDEYQLEIGDKLGAPSHFPTDFEYIGLRGLAGRSQLSLETNIEVGETATNHVYCFFPGKTRSIHVRATVDGSVIYDDEHRFSGHTCVPVDFTPSEPGSYFLRISLDDKWERTTYIYAHD